MNRLKILVLLLSLLLCITWLFACNSETPPTPDSGNTPDTPDTPEEPDTPTAPDGGDNTTPSEEEEQMDPVLYEILDFVVEVEEGRDPVILHISDTQIVDSTQQRYATRLGETLYNYWLPEKIEDRCYGYLRELFTTVKPDLILLTGDVIYGSFDDNGSALTSFIAFMESFGIPWAPVFGNHDNESNMGVAWQCAQFEAAEHCLFKRNTITGNGNYSVGIKQGGKLLRTFVMMDSNGCSGASERSLADGQMKTTVGFADDQIDWYEELGKEIRMYAPDTRFTFAFHIQLSVFATAYADAGYTYPIDIDRSENKKEGDFGYIGRGLKNPWDNGVYMSLKALGVDSVLVGHEHCNSASVVYEGIRLQFGQKCSTYDRANYVDMYGNIVGAYHSTETPLIGGTVMPMDSATGDFKDPYIDLCENAGGSIDWDSLPEEPVAPDTPAEAGATVPGLGTDDFTADSALSLSTVTLKDKTAYKLVAATQAELHIDTSLLSPDKVFTFTVYVPSGSDTLSGLGELAIRYKTPSTSGYINFEVTGNHGAYMPVADEWTTFSVPLADYEGLTKFSIIVPRGNTLYLTNMHVDVAVDGIPLNTLSHESGLSVGAVTHEGKAAYLVTASAQGKLYLPTAEIDAAQTLRFSVFVPNGSPTLALTDRPELAIRYKTTSGNGYITFSSTASTVSTAITLGTWQTVTVDLSAYNGISEFALQFPTGGTLYLADVTIS